MLKSSERIRERRAEGRTSDARAATLRSEALPNSWVGREASHAYSRSPRVYQRLCDLKVVHRNDIAGPQLPRQGRLDLNISPLRTAPGSRIPDEG